MRAEKRIRITHVILIYIYTSFKVIYIIYLKSNNNDNMTYRVFRSKSLIDCGVR